MAGTDSIPRDIGKARRAASSAAMTYTTRAIRKLLSGDHPRMVGAADVARINTEAATLPQDAVVVEMGPWLGALSVVLARHGSLHLVDNFVWTKDHERRVPGLVPPGESFRGLLEKILAVSEVSAELYETQFADFVWNGPDIDMLVIDSPKTASALCECLSPVVAALKPNSKVLIKNGLNPKHHDMMAYIDRMISDDLFAYTPQSDPGGKSNTIVITAQPKARTARTRLAELLDPNSVEASGEQNNAMGPYQIAQIIRYVEAGNWPKAYAELSALTPDPENILLWERLEPTIDTGTVNKADLGLFSELLVEQNDPVAHLKPAADVGHGPMAAVRSFWNRNADKPWRAASLNPTLIQRASEFGYMAWPVQIANIVAERDILDVGCGPGLHGIGYLCLGANSYLGVDPALRIDKDRAKNLVTKSRENFGWSPSEIAAAMPPWAAIPTKFEDLQTDRKFDVAILLDVLAHVEDVDDIMNRVAELLRPGGQIVFRHKNFYCWNGHQQAPKTVQQIDMTDPDQANLVDWRHINFDAPADHYIARMLNRVRLDKVLAAIERHFDLETLDERASTEASGLGRLTAAIRKQHRDLTERDLEIQSIFGVAVLK